MLRKQFKNNFFLESFGISEYRFRKNKQILLNGMQMSLFKINNEIYEITAIK